LVPNADAACTRSSSVRAKHPQSLQSVRLRLHAERRRLAGRLAKAQQIR
jgi:hypothetical protein